MIKALIVDDEPKARTVLKYYIESLVEEISEIRQADSVDQALEILRNYNPGIVFLDVEMPKRNGFDFLRSLVNPSFEVIFTTAYNQYAVQAIRFSALDYLLKPVDPDELRSAVDRYLKIQNRDSKNNLILYDNLVQNISKSEIKDFRLAVPSKDGVLFLTLNQIIRMQGDGNYTFIYTTNKKPIVTSKTLKYFDEMLEEFGFIRTHKSHLVNPTHISQMSHDHGYIVVSDGTEVEISRRKKLEVTKLLKLR
ncbi:LytTR family DNA-binding domain-containing protein [Dyadobacter sp. CY326]|uniref:LytR/AlgR family response regulator transcription factor n=1 Tax=Dyadobacter sp. CY326 TaxID=2907300 RepID=UPI001F20150F|nr:LytTR family DNA-binding domain-containing protein [Dyadobacter sp. CY326]MCE7068063.1 LytTR family DNA-binding domain-containing protein [Dyadobacter sp. CY326]